MDEHPGDVALRPVTAEDLQWLERFAVAPADGPDDDPGCSRLRSDP